MTSQTRSEYERDRWISQNFERYGKHVAKHYEQTHIGVRPGRWYQQREAGEDSRVSWSTISR